MAKDVSWFKMFLRHRAVFEAVTDEAAGQAIKAAFIYAESGQVPQIEPLANVVFCALRPSIDEAINDFRTIAERNRRNGAKGGRPRRNSENPENPEKPSGFLKNPNKPEERRKKIEDRRQKVEDRGEKKEDVGVLRGTGADKPPPACASAAHFKKPAFEEVDAYFRELGDNRQAPAFYDYYEGNGWRVGKNPMKDWKAAVRNWQRRSVEYDRQPSQLNRQPKPQESYSEQMDRIIAQMTGGKAE